jgi:hypothetical protein
MMLSCHSVSPSIVGRGGPRSMSADANFCANINPRGGARQSLRRRIRAGNTL